MERKTHDYHSSLAEPAEARPRQRVRLGDSLAFVADLGRGLPKEFADCDILYTEIAWERGYERFIERAGKGSDYAAYLAALAKIAATAPQPVIFICGKRALRGLPEPVEVTPVNLNTGGRFVAEAVAATFRCRLPEVRERHGKWLNIDTENLLRALAQTYRRVGDPCCGYGNTGRVFTEHGRDFVLSDLNPTCIGHIAEHAPSWRKES